jgi:HAD superfamily hydrolase (TIGR01549 family)
MTISRIKAVIFDLDDTLFDHRHSVRTALAAMQNKYDCFGGISLNDFEKLHIKLLNEIHLSKILTGEISLDEGRAMRFEQAFRVLNVDPTTELRQEAADFYRQNYLISTRLKPGALKVLEEIKKKYKTGIVTNNLIEEQNRKLQECKIEHLIDVMVTSEEVKITKPDPVIFNTVLGRLGSTPQEAVMIGDSWESDIMGAYNIGMKCIWVNTYEEIRDTNGIAVEIPSMEDKERILGLIESL